MSNSPLDKLIIIGDRVLLKLQQPETQTPSGLFLPPHVAGKEHIRSGYVMKTGPGYPPPLADPANEPWKEPEDEARYIPLQVRPGDLAIFLHKEAIEVQYAGEKYYIVPQQAILMLERDEELFE